MVTSKTFRCFTIEGVKRASQEFTHVFAHFETWKQKYIYELYAIHKFAAKKNCTSEDKLVSAVMNLKTKRLTWELHLRVWDTRIVTNDT